MELGCGLGDETLIAIAKNYRNLEALEMRENQIADCCVESLVDSESLGSLKRLVFTDIQITVRGVEALRASKWKTKLYLRSNAISHQQRGMLKEEYGKAFGNLGSDFWLGISKR